MVKKYNIPSGETQITQKQIKNNNNNSIKNIELNNSKTEIDTDVDISEGNNSKALEHIFRNIQTNNIKDIQKRIFYQDEYRNIL